MLTIIIHGKIKIDIIVVYNSSDELMKKLELFYAALQATLTLLERFQTSRVHHNPTMHTKASISC